MRKESKGYTEEQKERLRKEKNKRGEERSRVKKLGGKRKLKERKGREEENKKVE